MLSSNPWRDDDFTDLADRAHKAVCELSSMILNSKKPQLVHTHSLNHNAHALKRVQDLHRVHKRMSELRRKLVQLVGELRLQSPDNWPGVVRDSEDIQAIRKSSTDVHGYLEMDFAPRFHTLLTRVQ